MMITPSDKDYKETKLIKQGKRKMDADFVELAEWINSTFNVFVINIIYDIIDNTENRPRLSIIFEYPKDEIKFREGTTGNYDRQKQKKVAGKFRELINERISNSPFFENFLNTTAKAKYDTHNLLVIFTSFEPVNKEEVNSSIPEGVVQKLKTEFAFNDLWKIYRQFSGTTFFLYTDKQVEESSNNGTKKYFTEKYFNLLKVYDEFDYFNRETYSIILDSKENFDKNYQSNWFYYSR